MMIKPLCLGITILAFISNAYADSLPAHVTLISGINKIEAEAVYSKEDIEKGLGGRSKLPANNGMLFVFQNAGRYGIWMLDMKFAIDILWLDKEMKIIYIKANVDPDTFPMIFYPPQPTPYVLELNAGTVDHLHLQVGQKLENVAM